MQPALFRGVHRSAEKSEFDSALKGDWAGLLTEAGDKAASVAPPNLQACSTCGHAREDWIFDDHSVCKGCGDVMERPLDSGAEYRFFGLEERGGGDPCRVGAPMDTRFPGSALGTMILSHAQGGNASTRIAMARVRRYHTWNLLPYRERSLLQVFEQIALAATNHGFDVRTMDLAKEMYVKLVEHCDRRGMSRTSVVASCIYSALKQIGQPRKPKDVADIFHLSTAQFTKSLKYFQEILCMAYQRGLLSDQKMTPASQPSTRASNYISKPLSCLALQRAEFTQLDKTAKDIADELEDKELCPENMPPSLAAGVIAFVLGKTKHMGSDITTEKIAEVCGVSEGTLSKCLKKIDHIATSGYLEAVKHLG
jgi:transcription initiation factor TFIIIB Brf1 subunit/transcription initiation factor TFIIB